MKLLSLHIEGFGKFHNQDVSFTDGLNVVYGQNEAGKSTLHTFIRGMLFGIERQRGRASKKDTYIKYEPWTGGVYEGWLRLESDGEVFRIERRFQKGNKRLTIVNETLGREEEPANALWDRLRCGLSETAYDNTISIGQLKCATDGGMVSELRNYIANLNTSGNIALNITKASTYLKTQRRQLENQLVPEAARDYNLLLGEIRKIEQEISGPQYSNQLIACRSKKSAVKKELEERQREKESLLEKAAKGRQILLNSQFSDQASIEAYEADTQRIFADYQTAKAACAKKSRTVYAVLFFFLSVFIGISAGILLLSPQLILNVAGRYFPGLALQLSPPSLRILGISYSLLCVGTIISGLIQLGKKRKSRNELEASTRLLQEIFARHLGSSDISSEAMKSFENKMGEFLRLSKAVTQSEETLAQLSEEISSLQSQEEGCLAELELQQHTQWELEQKLEHLDACKTKAEAFRHILAENERIQEELDALDLAQETMTSLSTSIRDSFGLYLNKTASELIEGITGGIYTSMSIDQNLDIYMNTPARLVPIEQVSSGTMDQIYLAVRLAAARLVQNGTDAMPLIFDDSFVMYDDERLKTALKWLNSAYNNQIIIFTCHHREAALLASEQIAHNLIRL